MTIRIYVFNEIPSSFALSNELKINALRNIFNGRLSSSRPIKQSL